MKLKSVELKDFKRFTHLKIQNIPKTAKLIVLIGTNGSGKTSLFEAFKQWVGRYGQISHDSDVSYLSKINNPNFLNLWTNDIKIDFYENLPPDAASKRKIFYIRSAYRNEPDFTLSDLSNIQSRLIAPRITRLIDNDASVSDNYKRIISNSVTQIFSGNFDNNNIKELREKIIGEIRDVMVRLFGNLTLTGVGDPLRNGAFYFDKGTAKDFHFKNLSGGEKAAFDLILDIIAQRVEFDDSIYCIDEPDIHLHTKLQGNVLEEIFKLVPDKCQLIISTHSIGMIRKAVEIQKMNPEQVVFLDFHDKNPDEDLLITPVKVTRDLWKKILGVALDDLSELISPKQIVICEGKPLNLGGRNKEFDAQIYRVIFNEEFPDTDFVSVGNTDNVRAEKIDLVTILQNINKGVDFIKIIDRDDRSDAEVQEEINNGIKVLNRRDIENYLLDDEIVEKLCRVVGKESLLPQCLTMKEQALQESIGRGNPIDDIKSAAGSIYIGLKTTLQLTQCGNTKETFLRDTIAPLVTSDTNVYSSLKQEIFGI